jgi:dTDP-glucose pyrophosphorylase
MTNWESLLLLPVATIHEAIETIDATAMQVAMVVDADRRLLGTVTDGDIRRGILKGVSLQEPVTKVMNPNPTAVRSDEPWEKIFTLMKRRRLKSIPLLDALGCVVGLETIDQMRPFRSFDNPVILMAGGLGSRLRPLTDDCPKPLLKVGGKALMETLLETFIESGFHRFHISVNYKADMVKAHFGDGSAWGVDIAYLHEDQRLGTAGPLALMPEPPTKPILVMNGDLLTKVNFHHLLDFHVRHRAQATMCIREYDFQIPFGVVKTKNHLLTEISEKPSHKFFVNAGIYVLEPEVLGHIPPNRYFDMPSLFERILAAKQTATVFPIREYWLDIGRLDDFERANGEFQEMFE